MRLLFARVGVPHCPICHKEVSRRSVEDLVKSVVIASANDAAATDAAAKRGIPVQMELGGVLWYVEMQADSIATLTVE